MLVFLRGTDRITIDAMDSKRREAKCYVVPESGETFAYIEWIPFKVLDNLSKQYELN